MAVVEHLPVGEDASIYLKKKYQNRPKQKRGKVRLSKLFPEIVEFKLKINNYKCPMLFSDYLDSLISAHGPKQAFKKMVHILLKQQILSEPILNLLID